MLRNLRIKFVIIITVLVGAVLIGVLGGSLYSAWQSQREIIVESLDRGIQGYIRDMPRWEDMDDMDPGARPKDTQLGRQNMFALIVDLDAQGVVVATNNAPVMLDASTMEKVLEEAIDSEQDMKVDSNLHIAWKRKPLVTGGVRVVLCDTTMPDDVLSKLLNRYLMITGLSLCLLVLISIGLSGWMIKPVEEAWQQQQQFVADASHELKTPLAVIIANTQILMADDKIANDSRRWIESTQDEATHMRNLVEELLELARTDEAGGNAQVMQHNPVDFSDLVDSACLEYDAIAFERGTFIDEEVDEGIVVAGDTEWLERLVKILIENACKYTRGDSPVHVRLTDEGKRCTLSVNNKGDVIDAEDLPHVFDRFYRTDKARTRGNETGGFGLGLAIAKGITESHKGTIACTSNEVEGTTFTVTLPQAVR